jgi:hypothetical protein
MTNPTSVAQSTAYPSCTKTREAGDFLDLRDLNVGTVYLARADGFVATRQRAFGAKTERLLFLKHALKLINIIPAYYVRSRHEATGGADLGEERGVRQ